MGRVEVEADGLDGRAFLGLGPVGTLRGEEAGGGEPAVGRFFILIQLSGLCKMMTSRMSS